MTSVRQRVLELVSDPAAFDGELVCPADPSLAEAKLEADAHLAICIDSLTAELADSTPHRRTFQAALATLIKENVPLLLPKKDHYVGCASAHFRQAFVDTYYDRPLVDKTLGTRVGRHAVKAARRYYEMGSGYVATADPRNQQERQWLGHAAVNLESYRAPSEMFHVGFLSIGLHMQEALRSVNALGIPLANREAYLRKHSSDVRSRASLSLIQFRSIQDKHMTVENDRLANKPGIDQNRRLPKGGEIITTLRPHLGCAAQPELPAVGDLNGGSAIGRLWNLATDLAVDAGLHAIPDGRLRILKHRLDYANPPLEEKAGIG